MKLFAGIFLLLAASLNPTISLAEKKPNVILIVSDDAGFSDIGAFGGEVETPNLDRLSYEGLRFSQFYTNARCSPTRASLLTGKYPQSVGVGALSAPRFRTELPGYLGYLNPNGNSTLAEILAANGYNTIITGKWHLGGYHSFGEQIQNQTNPTGRGFDRFFGQLHGEQSYTKPKSIFINRERIQLDPKEPFYATDAFVEYAINFISEFSRSDDPDKPFFLYLPFTAPHTPLEAPEDLVEKYRSVYEYKTVSSNPTESRDEKVRHWEDLMRERYKKAKELGVINQNAIFPRQTKIAGKIDRISMDLPVHAAMIDRMDQNIGYLLEYLESTKELENTIIIYMSDNGGAGPHHSVANTPFLGQKANLWEGGIRTHFLMWSPKLISKPGRIVDVPIHTIDVVPTVLDLLKIESEYKVHGQSFAKALTYPGWREERTFFWDLYGSKAVRKGDWKYLLDQFGNENLFNLQSNPTETRNLMEHFPAIAASLKEMHYSWASENNVLPYEAVKEAQSLNGAKPRKSK